jgi:hypothetical protein
MCMMTWRALSIRPWSKVIPLRRLLGGVLGWVLHASTSQLNLSHVCNGTIQQTDRACLH